MGYDLHPSSDAVPKVALHPPQAQRRINSSASAGLLVCAAVLCTGLGACESQLLISWRYTRVPASKLNESHTNFALPGARKEVKD